MNTETQDIKLLNLISNANDAQVDSIWAILNTKKSESIAKLLAFVRFYLLICKRC
jgi:hypothetical protein